MSSHGMEERPLSTWKEFRAAIAQLREENATKRGDLVPDVRILFRGLASDSWPLSTTLERRTDEAWSFRSYAELTLRCMAEVESYSGRTWNLPDWKGVEGDFPDHDVDPLLVPVPEHWYKYWIYLRHHGFPSPLLDWTESENIAAFFAFGDDTVRGGSGRVAVYAYIEFPSGAKTVGGGSPWIGTLGPYVAAHKRHFLQQSWYTVCAEFKDRTQVFVPHDRVVGRDRMHQDRLIRFTLPASDRCLALAELQRMNITRYTLFQTEEALMSTLAFNKIEKRSHDVQRLLEANELA